MKKKKKVGGKREACKLGCNDMARGALQLLTACGMDVYAQGLRHIDDACANGGLHRCALRRTNTITIYEMHCDLKNRYRNAFQ